MATDLEPIVGNWYQNLEDDLVFQVMTVDEDEALIDIQHEDGDLEQVDLEEWDTWALKVVEEPDDWTGAMDDSDADRLADDDEEAEADDWPTPGAGTPDQSNH